MASFSLPGALRRIRRTADLSQRELAGLLNISKSAVAGAEAASRGLEVGLLATAAELAGLRLALLDGAGAEVAGLADGAVRDAGGRRFPAHLDTRYGDEDWWYDAHRYGRPRPWYTFDRSRDLRDGVRRHSGTPHDHLLPQPGDSPAHRAAERTADAVRRAREERQRRFLAGEFASIDLGFDCSCPPACEELDDRNGAPIHAPDCSCHCDLA